MDYGDCLGKLLKVIKQDKSEVIQSRSLNALLNVKSFNIYIVRALNKEN